VCGGGTYGRTIVASTPTMLAKRESSAYRPPPSSWSYPMDPLKCWTNAYNKRDYLHVSSDAMQRSKVKQRDERRRPHELREMAQLTVWNSTLLFIVQGGHGQRSRRWVPQRLCRRWWQRARAKEGGATKRHHHCRASFWVTWGQIGGDLNAYFCCSYSTYMRY
jgi:hypothetical protein